MFALLMLGVAQGLRHAIEPDHLAAVAVIAGEQRRPLAAASVGAWWGLGHAASLVLFAGGLAAMGVFVPEAWEANLERGVGVVLVLLGARALRRSIGQAHDEALEHVHVGNTIVAVRPFVVGVVHGLAGTGALTAALIAAVPGSSMRVAAALAFGVGATVGMTAISGLAGVGLSSTARDPRASRVVGGLSGSLSLALGVVWVVA